MKRKVIKQGHNTLTITLPAEWVERNGVKASDSVEISEEENRLVVSKDEAKSASRIEINLTGLDFSSVKHKTRAAYKLGYDEILLTFDDPMTKEFKTGESKAVMHAINEEVRSIMLGCEVIQQGKNSCLIKDFAVASPEEIDKILRKVFIMITEYGEEMLEHTKSMNRPMLETMREKHFNISKLILYCLRILNRNGYINYSKTAVMYYILSSLDDILDIEKYCSVYMTTFKQKKLRETTISTIKSILDEFRRFYEFFYKPDIERLTEFSKKRWDIVYGIKDMAKTDFPRNEIIVLTSMEQILELLLHLFESKMSLDC